MPTYEYVCKKCGATIEKVQSFSEKPLRRHQECGGDLQKVFHARGVVFKGPGFYSTDARSSSNASSKGDGSQGKDGKTKEGSKAKEGSGSKDGSGSSSKEPSTTSSPTPSTSAD